MNILPYIIKKENRVNGVIITFVEITRRIKDLKEQERLISDHETLLDSLSHDFKTPITSLALTVDRLKTVIPIEMKAVHPLLTLVENGVKKMQKIILELTDSRNQEFKYKAEEELLNIEHILEDVMHTLSDHILESSAVVKTEIEISEITYSRRKLRSIIYNLVLNSIKYRSPDRTPEINVKTGLDDDYFTVTISDNGAGIHPDQHDKIFSKYFRAERITEGSGLGLYIVSEMVHNSGGKILLRSEEGKGSEFRIFLKRQ